MGNNELSLNNINQDSSIEQTGRHTEVCMYVCTCMYVCICIYIYMYV